MTILYNDKYKFNHVIADDGMVITEYKPTSDIRTYSSFTEGYFPLTYDLGKYYEISIEQDEEYKALMVAPIEENKEEKNIKDAKTL